MNASVLQVEEQKRKRDGTAWKPEEKEAFTARITERHDLSNQSKMHLPRDSCALSVEMPLQERCLLGWDVASTRRVFYQAHAMH